MTGHGHAHGAITVLNATATGRGCGLAIRAGIDATWDWGGSFAWKGQTDDRLARACLAVAQQRMGRSDQAAIATIATFPPSRGLKTSSAAAAAMLRAAGLAEDELEAACVDACRRAGVTLTGAFDDQVAVVRGGCHLADNVSQTILARIEVPSWQVAVWVPSVGISKKRFKGLDASGLAPALEAAEDLLRAGDVPAALDANGVAFTRFYRQAGLPVSDAPAHVAKDHGALAAGLSGTGPAVAALFAEQVDLPEVPGGNWAWSEVVQ